MPPLSLMPSSKPGRLRARLAGVIVGLVLCCTVVGGLALAYVNHLAQQARTADQGAAQRVLEATRWRAWVHITNDAAMAAIMNTNPVSQGVLEKRVQEGLSALGTLSQSVARAATSADEQASIQAVQGQGVALNELVKTLRQTKADGELAKAVLGVSRELIPKASAYLKAIDGVSSFSVQ